MIPVCSDSDAYRAAAAELPLSVRVSNDPAGAVVVVPGDTGWCDRVRTAVRGGARAIVVSQPGAVPVDRIRALVVDVGNLPVLVERAFLRPDAIARVAEDRLVDGIEARPRLVVVDCVASRATLSVVLRDAAGWVRTLAGGGLVVRAVGAGLAQLEPADGVGAPAVLGAVCDDGGGDGIRAQILGEVRSTVDASSVRTDVSTTTGRGHAIAPARHEAPERLALRRAAAAIAHDVRVTDLAELADDAELAELVAQGIARS